MYFAGLSLLQYVQCRETIFETIQTPETNFVLHKMQAVILHIHPSRVARGWHVNQLVSDNSI